MLVSVVRTHKAGRPVDARCLGQEPAIEGILTVSLASVNGLRRASRIANLGARDRSVGPALLPALHDIELLALGERAMMLSGFEEVRGARHYQGWWVRWA